MSGHPFTVGTRVRARRYIVERDPNIAGRRGVVTVVSGRSITVSWHGLAAPTTHYPSHLVALSNRPSREARGWQGDEPSAPCIIDPCRCPDTHLVWCPEHPTHPGNGVITDPEAIQRHAVWLGAHLPPS